MPKIKTRKERKVNSKRREENPNKGVWKRFIKLIWKSKLPYLWIGIYIITGIIAIKIGIKAPSYTAELFNGNVSVSLVVSLVFATVASTLIGQLSGIPKGIAEAKIDMNLRTMIWGKMLHLPVGFFDKSKPRDMVSRITTDTEVVSRLVVGTLIGEITTLYLFYETAKQLASYDVKLMYSIFVFIPVLILVSYIFGRLLYKTNNREQYRVSRLTQVLAELVSNVPLIKSFANEEKETERGKDAIRKLYKANISSGVVGMFFIPAFSLINLIQTVLIVVVGIALLNDGDITTTMWTAYFLYVGNLVNIVNSKAGTWKEIKSAQGVTDRISRLMEHVEEEYYSSKSVGKMEGDIVLNNVSFKFGEQQVLENVSCRFKAGNVTALVGLSGCGKTTILNLIDRFYLPVEGDIEIGNQNIMNYNLKEYRQSITYVSQNSGVMSGTIRENILYGINRVVDEDELIAAARLGNAYEFILKFKNGFDTEVGEMGNKLSGGQKQRIAISRAILKDPKYLLLDEATANLDANAAEEVLSGLKNLMKGRTVIMVTHDPNSMLIADEIIVLENGKITSVSTHEKLIEKNEFYREITDMH
ncbi:ABC transporter ATP-binding protein [Lysinibacillus fusiformis]|uniref:ABC transporter ATP-binding protein n=1 Tax=Lysinibacillus sp. PWR01 TaxID=3342384 RepID=UPI00372D120D